jgi:hypothetical protein
VCVCGSWGVLGCGGNAPPGQQGLHLFQVGPKKKIINKNKKKKKKKTLKKTKKIKKNKNKKKKKKKKKQKKCLAVFAPPPPPPPATFPGRSATDRGPRLISCTLPHHACLPE